MATSDVVVSHGGPATISEARAAGHLPVVVPRDPAFGEHVDDHQKRFSAWLASKGLVDRHTDEASFLVALDEALERGRTAGAEADAAVAASVERFGRLVDEARSGKRVRAEDGPVVVFIAGFGRSGSTLLERLLGETPGVTCLGEVVHLWQRGLLDDESCACGEAFSQCPTWQAIGEIAFGGWDQVDVQRVFELRSAVDRQRRIPVTALPTTTPATRADLVEYAGYYAAIYRAASTLTGSPVVVDSSKHVSLAFVAEPRRRPRPPRPAHGARPASGRLQLVQGGGPPRGHRRRRVSAHAAVLRAHEQPQVADEQPARRGPPRRAGCRSRGCSTNSWSVTPRRPCRRRPRSSTCRLSPASRLWTDGVILATSHSVAGNPMRFTTGPVRLRLDDAWTTQLPSEQRRLVSVLTAPLQRWYGRG